MNLPSDYADALVEASQLCAQGRFLEAERIYRVLAAPGPHRHIALEQLADLFLAQHRLDEAHDALQELVTEDSDSLHFRARLANFLDAAGQTGGAVQQYLDFIDRQPDIAIAHFNLALLLKKLHRSDEALAAYQEALRLEIERPEEAYSNMGVIYSEQQNADAARAMFQRALDIAPDYVPALFNLAGHYEELGKEQDAIDLYEQIQRIDPGHWESLARLAYPRTITAESRHLVDRIEAGIAGSRDDMRAQEGLHFALGKAYDDLGMYKEAARAYVAANETSKQRVLPYTCSATEEAFDKLIAVFDSTWIEARVTDSPASPIFICGMYRSGSTLLERMLGAHPAIAAGGELDVLPWLISQRVGIFPQGAVNVSRSQLRQIAEEYDAKLKDMFPDSPQVIDKRPDNFLRVGLIRAIFPNARIIQTRREIRDNSLSLYFQQFDRAANYANDLSHIAHYYGQQERLFAHWRACFGDDSICTVDYEALVDSPEEELRRVLEYLGVEWHAAVLEFHRTGGMVKTASIWQVRQGLHSRSRERWRHYEAALADLAAMAPASL